MFRVEILCWRCRRGWKIRRRCCWYCDRCGPHARLNPYI